MYLMYLFAGVPDGHENEAYEIGTDGSDHAEHEFNQFNATDSKPGKPKNNGVPPTTENKNVNNGSTTPPSNNKTKSGLKPVSQIYTVK